MFCIDPRGEGPFAPKLFDKGKKIFYILYHSKHICLVLY